MFNHANHASSLSFHLMVLLLPATGENAFISIIMVFLSKSSDSVYKVIFSVLAMTSFLGVKIDTRSCDVQCLMTCGGCTTSNVGLILDLVSFQIMFDLNSELGDGFKGILEPWKGSGVLFLPNSGNNRCRAQCTGLYSDGSSWESVGRSDYLSLKWSGESNSQGNYHSG
jgi:hypothetical protein